MQFHSTERSFLSVLETLDTNTSKLIQTAMDGLSVNWIMYKQIKPKRKVNQFPELLNLGSCSFYFIHGVFKRGNNPTLCDERTTEKRTLLFL